MSIASRINEMAEHLRNDWDSIDKLGLDITEENSNDNLDKNIENIAPVLDRFYNKSSDKTDLSENGIVGKTSQDGDPTPENPVEINNLSGDVEYKVGGKNKLNVNANTYLKNGITSSTLNQTIIFNGTTSDGWTNSDFNDCFLKANENYIFSISNSNAPSEVKFKIWGYEDESSSLSINVNADVTFTPNTNITKIKIVCEQMTANKNYDIEIKCQIEKGSTTTSYEPYISESFPLSLKSRNLFDKDSGFRLGYINTSGNFVNSRVTACFINQYIPCQPNTTYTISFAKIISNLGCPIYYDKNKNFLSRENTQYNTTSRTITTPSNCYYMIIQFNYNDIQMTQEIIDSVNCQVEEGSTPTDYEPYYDINLCNISDYKDRIYSQNGEFYLEKKTGKVILDGSENITQNYNQSMFRAPLDNFIHRIVSPSNLVKSNYYTCRKYTDMYNGILETGLEMGDQGNDYIYIRNKDITSINDFKTWLSTHNTEVQYVLATPTTTEITQENYPTLYYQLLAIQEFLTKYKINNEFLLDYSSPEIEY